MIDTAGVPREIPDREEPEAPPPSDAGAAAVERLFESHAERLRRYVFRYVRSWEVAQDLVHDLFLRLWDRREDLG
ncbi:MAG: sigma factor, partial [Gemmatimonadota bacterium]